MRDGQKVAVLGAPPEFALDLPGGSSRVSSPAGADAVIAFIHTSADLSGTAARHALDAARADRLAWWQLLDRAGVRLRPA